MFFAAVLCLLPLAVQSHRLLSIAAQEPDAAKQLLRLQNRLSRQDSIYYWERKRVGVTEVFADHNTTSELIHALTDAGLAHKVREDARVEEWLAAEAAGATTEADRFLVDADPAAFTLSQYHSAEEMNAFTKALARNFPDIAQVFTVGYTWEGRRMQGLKIGKAGASSAGRPSVYIEAGVHAREWIAPAAALYLINQLVFKYTQRPDVKALVDAVDVYVMPSGNPDGYEYSRESLVDGSLAKRYWRKTRSDYNLNLFSTRPCYGADPNRNYNWHWNTTGISGDPCSSIYAGPKPLSEVETSNTAAFLTKLKESANLRLYVSLHSYGQEWLVPYGSNVGIFPPNYKDMFQLAIRGVGAIQKVNSATYVALNSAELYESSGAADDWARGVLDVPFSYTLEIRPSSDNPGFPLLFVSRFGLLRMWLTLRFLLPASQIIPTSEEVFEGLLSVASAFIPAK